MLADTPRCIEWWWADRTGRVVPLDVDTDPESAEFYDYTTTEWYREPERTGAATLAGPYVDFICTHEYTFTLAAPVRPAGRFIGVAAADILATQVERLVLPGLCRLGTPAAGSRGRARQRPRPGHRLDQREPAARGCPAPAAARVRLRDAGRARSGTGAAPAAVDPAHRAGRVISGPPRQLKRCSPGSSHPRWTR